MKVLHPDLERDAAERQKKMRTMQEVTAAYARSDLHTLLRLELEWIDGAQADAARLSDERLQAYTEFLKSRPRRSKPSAVPCVSTRGTRTSWWTARLAFPR